MAKESPPPDLIQLPRAGEFEIKCLTCGSTNVEIDNSTGCGGSQTGPYGSIDIVCRNCNATKEIISH